MRWIGVVVALAACGGGKGGGKDAADTGGDGLVWVDADGEVVDGVVYLGDELFFEDADGHFWLLDTWTGNLAGVNVDVAYADEACEAVPWFENVEIPLGVVMQTAEISEGERYFVVPDGTELVELDPSYCGAFSGLGSSLAVAVADLLEVERPPGEWSAPLHPEVR